MRFTGCLLEEKMKRIRSLVECFRTAIEKAQYAGEFGADYFGRFPRGCCGDASDMLAQYLVEHGIRTKYIVGTYWDDENGDSQSHAWLLLNEETIIDITGDQFQYNPVFLNFNKQVYIGPMNAFHRLFEVEPWGIRDLDRLDDRQKDLYRKIIKHIR